MDYNRKLRPEEKILLQHLITKAQLELSNQEIDDLLVRNLDDGGMGSLLIFPSAYDNKERLFGKTASECYFLDIDSVKVIASLNLDTDGNLYELDIWKTDFTPLIKIPDNLDEPDRLNFI